MPTISQLVKRGRTPRKYKTKASQRLNQVDSALLPETLRFQYFHRGKTPVFPTLFPALV